MENISSSSSAPSTPSSAPSPDLFLNINRDMLKSIKYKAILKLEPPALKRLLNVDTRTSFDRLNKKFLKQKSLNKEEIYKALKIQLQKEKKNQLQMDKEYNRKVKNVKKSLNKASLDGKVYTFAVKSQEDLRLILSNLKIGNKQYVNINYGDKTYTINQESLARLLSNLDDLIIQAETGETYGSDPEFFMELLSNNIEFVTIQYQKRTGNTREGAFFSYTHNLDFDLTSLQIFSISDLELKTPKGDFIHNYDENCLIKSLIESGKLSKEEIDSCKIMSKSGHITVTDLKNKLLVILDRPLILNTIRTHGDTFEGKTETLNKSGSKDSIEINLLDKHFFVQKKMDITGYAINNYSEIKDKKGWNKYYMANKKSSNRNITSFNVVKLLLENKSTLLTPIGINNRLLDSPYFNNIDEINNLEFDEKINTRLNKYKNKEEIAYIGYLKEYSVLFNMKLDELVDDYSQGKLDKNIVEYIEDELKPTVYCADFETTTDGDSHVPYLISHKKMAFGEKCITHHGTDCGQQFLDSIKTKNNIVYWHNMGYDIRFLIKYFTADTIIQKSNSKIINYNGVYNGKNFTFKCSYAMIAKPLRSFNKMFNLGDVMKEIMPYKLYNNENVKKLYVSIEEAKQVLIDEEKEDDIPQFLANIMKWECNHPTDPSMFNHIKYSGIYCEMDIKTQSAGLTTFRQWFIEGTGLDIYHYITLASLSYDYLVKEGCFEEVYEFSGNIQQFIQKCVVGGRTMTRENMMYHIEKILSDFDGVSLYPSAMERLPGFLKGIPEVIGEENLNYEFLSKQDGYFIEVNITKINKHYKFPLINNVDSNGIRNFSNEAIGIHHMDKITLEDLINFQDIEFEIIKGYYFNNGVNDKIKETIRYLFNKRLEMKKIGNPIQEIFKLLMNSSYGKTCLKPIESDYLIISDNKLDSYIRNNYNYIKYFSKIPDSNKTVVRRIKSINNHFNSCHIGTEILSMSKRIMNEVMCLSEDLDIDIYYQDTDSMHIEANKIPMLADAFRVKYNKELIGKNLGQFHSDFDFKSEEEVVAVEEVFLGKKSYCDKVKLVKDGVVSYDYHMRMKGIPHKALHHVIKNDFKNNPMDMYIHLYKGNPITFNLLQGTVAFEALANYNIRNRTEFKRTVQFTNNQLTTQVSNKTETSNTNMSVL